MRIESRGEPAGEVQVQAGPFWLAAYAALLQTMGSGAAQEAAAAGLRVSDALTRLIAAEPGPDVPLHVLAHCVHACVLNIPNWAVHNPEQTALDALRAARELGAAAQAEHVRMGSPTPRLVCGDGNGGGNGRNRK